MPTLLNIDGNLYLLATAREAEVYTGKLTRMARENPKSDEQT